MVNKLKRLLLKSKIFTYILVYIKQILLYKKTKTVLKQYEKNNTVFYIGIPVHTNLGDLAQGVCIRNWIKNNFTLKKVIEIETNAIVNTRFSVLNHLKKIYSTEDIIVFQSGYTTTDLGGYADCMHKAVISALPKAKMLMMPQTIFFKNEKNKQETSLVYNSAENMLFLARDRISYAMAKEMFPDIGVVEFPDIVTTLIGKYEFDYRRDGILCCFRNDSEKFYSDKELDDLICKCEQLTKVLKADTTKNTNREKIVNNALKYIEDEIELYSHYKVIITDRYHGTILSLAANTPVIVVRTSDHKVSTGVEWFRGVYDDYVCFAADLDEAYGKAMEIMKKNYDYKLQPHFNNEFYDKLLNVFKEVCQ